MPRGWQGASDVMLFAFENNHGPARYYRGRGSIFLKHHSCLRETFTMTQSAPAKNWVFTINNPEEWHMEAIQSLDFGYLVYQVEVGDEGTPHIQGYVQLREKQRKSALLKHMKHHRWLEVFGSPKNYGFWAKQRGTSEEASHYCKKPVPECDCKHCKDLERFDDYWEDGVMSHGDTAAKLETVARVIKAKGLQHAIDRFPSVYLQYHAGMKSLAVHFIGKRDFQTEVTVVWGTAGKGKTHYARMGPTPYLLPAPGGQGQADFFGDYRPDQHQTVVLDDFYGGWRYTTFLRVADCHPTEVQCKGGYLEFLARHLVITSNSPPHEWYPKVLADPRRADSFNRRIHNIIHFTEAGWVITKVAFFRIGLQLIVRDTCLGRLLLG